MTFLTSVVAEVDVAACLTDVYQLKKKCINVNPNQEKTKRTWKPRIRLLPNLDVILYMLDRMISISTLEE